MYYLLSLSAHILELIVSFSFLYNIFDIKSFFKEKIKWVPFLTALVIYSLEYGIYVTFDSTIINIFAFLIINYIITVLFFSATHIKAFISSIFLSTALTASEFSTLAVLSIGLNNSIDTYKSSEYVFILFIIISRFVFYIFTKLSEHIGIYLQGNKDKGIPSFLYIYPFTAILILYVFWIVSTKHDLSRNISIAIAVASFAILVSVFLTFTFYSRTSKKINDLYKEQREAERIKTDTAYYSILDKQNETLKMLTHDEKNHLLAIKSIADNPDVDAYVDKIYGEIKENTLFGNTNNKYLDLLLNKYQSECETYGIDFDYSIKTANLLFMNSVDLISMMSNILDNAVEAAKQSSERKISLSINRNNNFDIINCTNSGDEKPNSSGEELITAKTEAGIHGYGFKSIKRTAKKYGGEVDWKYDNSARVFTITIVFSNN